MKTKHKFHVQTPGEVSETDQLKSMLSSETSRRNTDMVVNLVIQDPKLFEALFSIYMSNEEPFSRRAAWVIDTITEDRPGMLLPFRDKMIHMLTQFRHDGLKRHTLRMLNRTPLPGESEIGFLITICFDWLVSARESIAVKVTCMDLLYRISLSEPDIRKELTDSIEWRLEEESAGFRSHAKKVLKKLSC